MQPAVFGRSTVRRGRGKAKASDRGAGAVLGTGRGPPAVRLAARNAAVVAQRALSEALADLRSATVVRGVGAAPEYLRSVGADRLCRALARRGAQLGGATVGAAPDRAALPTRLALARLGAGGLVTALVAAAGYRCQGEHDDRGSHEHRSTHCATISPLRPAGADSFMFGVESPVRTMARQTGYWPVGPLPAGPTNCSNATSSTRIALRVGGGAS